MTLARSTAIRETCSQAMITAAGANALLKFYNGTRPSSGGAVTTLLATLTGGASVIGTSTGGVLTFGAFTQSNGSHVAGTPTWARLTTSGGTFVADFSIGSDITFTGTIATGVDITMGTWTITQGDA